MSKKKLLWIAVPVLIVVGAGVAGAGYKHYGGHHNPERMVERISEKLDLNADQRQKLEAVKEAMLEGKRQMREERVQAMNQIIDEIRKPELEQTEVRELIDQRKAKLDVMVSLMLDPVIEFHKSLNDDQRQKIINLIEVFRDWGHGRHHHG